MTSKIPVRDSIAVASDLSTSEDICSPVLSGLEQGGFAGEDVFAVHLALQEAFINAVRHGNKMDPEKEVTVEYIIDAEKVAISVSDQGDGFDPQAVPDPRIGENLYKPDGRGLLLMRAYMDEVHYNKRGNAVRMVRYKQRPPVTEGASQGQA